jgi:hypothetical protein
MDAADHVGRVFPEGSRTRGRTAIVFAQETQATGHATASNNSLSMILP